MQLFLHPVDLRLRHTFTIAHDSRDVQPTLIVELRDAAGRSGLGEATATPYYGVTIDRLMQGLETIRPLLETADDATPEDVWQQAYSYLADNPFALCAVDQAMHDLAAQRAGLPLYAHWGLDPAHNPLTNYTIGLDSVAKMVAKMREMPWPIYKIKLGTADDLGLVRALRQHIDTQRSPTDRSPTRFRDARFRVDANCAWTADQTLAYAPALKQLGVEFIEQPLPADDWTGMKRVYDACALPVIADEGCITESDVARCAGHFHGINIKLTKCGGLTPARRMLAEARSLGLKTMVGCMTESSVGISAIAHLLPLLDFVDMDGSLLIANDPATGVTFDYGRVIYADRTGTGAKLNP